jgi:hypothetical protein
MGADEQLPPIAAIEDVIEALRRLGVDESVPGVELALAYSAVGAAERNAFATEQHVRARGAGPAEFGEAVGAVLDGAACHSDLEVLALLEWRITRTTQALALLDLSGPHGDVDPLARTILLTTGALSGLLAAAVTMRDLDRSATATRGSARALRAAVQALDEATADVSSASADRAAARPHRLNRCLVRGIGTRSHAKTSERTDDHGHRAAA